MAATSSVDGTTIVASKNSVKFSVPEKQPRGVEGLEEKCKNDDNPIPSLAYCFPSSGLKLRQQVSTLLRSIELSYSKQKDIEDFLAKLRKKLIEIPAVEPVELHQSRKNLKSKGVQVPLSDPDEPVQWKFGFLPPRDVHVVGSFSLRNAIKKGKGQKCNIIDLLVEIPQGVLQQKDYLSNRYFHKRAHYLSHLAVFLNALPLLKDYELTFGYLHEDHLKPIIVIQPKDNLTKSIKWTIRLILSYPISELPLSKLSPSQANLKAFPEPSSDYNQSVLMDSTEINLQHLSFFKETSKKSPAFVQTCQLMKAWAMRVGLYRSNCSESFGNWSMLGFERFGWLINFIVAHVLQGGTHEAGRISGLVGVSVLQSDPAALWRHVIDWLAKWNHQSVISMKVIPESQPFSIDVFKPMGSGLIDPTGLINLFIGIPEGALRLLHCFAAKASMLLNSTYNFFDCIYYKSSCSFVTCFDYNFTLKISLSDASRLSGCSKANMTSNALRFISKNLGLALADRVRGFALLENLQSGESNHFMDNKILMKLNQRSKDLKSDAVTIKIGLLLNPSRAFDLVTYGPSPEISQVEVEKFRAFWGDRSELRRFQDGSIKECVNWPVENPLERLQIPKQIVNWVLTKKLGLSSDGSMVSSLIGCFDSLIVENPKIVQAIYEKDPKELGFTNVMITFNEFSKELKALNENDFLPLAITSVHPASDNLRYSSVFVPGPRKSKGSRFFLSATKCLPSLCCHLKFESSGKWPESLEAIQKIKAALLIRISEGLAQKQSVIKQELAFDSDALPIEQNVVLNVLHRSGYSFQLSIFYEREEMLLERALSGIGENQEFSSEWALQAHKSYRRRFLESRRHHDAITALQMRFPSFTYTVRLVKRWLSAHMLLSFHISVEVAELLAAVVYLVPHGPSPPNTGSGGFFRFLKFMKEWDWRKEPILLPLETSVGLEMHTLTHFPVELARKSAENFQGFRKKDPGFFQFTYFIATEKSLGGTCWMFDHPRAELSSGSKIQMKPNQLVADRIRMLAQASLSLLGPSFESCPIELDVKTLFRSPFQDYDFIFTLNRLIIPRDQQAVDRVESSTEKETWSMKNMELGDEEPVGEFLKTLVELYGETMMFFYDQFGGAVIGGVVDPTLINQPRSIKIEGNDFLRKAVDGDFNVQKLDQKPISRAKVLMDLNGTLKEIGRIGKGVIDKILRKGVDY
ncbi:Nrap protein [Phakopsora pachyrhizi]|uniref:U3 small nucleolar RNA-associated protein 22 n=1 Tax=Phakopsora pachyrhizi TaxID=170000 RepID=A0AAV0BUP8_PHAPC|nr:Nrap protein [Phakopsora pachyrhizi]CAH7689992.1 Nrap protein [Phakopsora pachyrhizi]